MEDNTLFVNAMNLKEVRRAIGMLEVNIRAMRPEEQPAKEALLLALVERERRLIATAKMRRAN